MRTSSLNVIGVRAFRAGLIECGWTQEALSQTTRLIDSIAKYQHEPEPPRGNSRPSKRRNPGDSRDDLTDNTSKRHCVFDPHNRDHFSIPPETDPDQLRTDEDLTRCFSMSGALLDALQIIASRLATDEYLTHYLSTAGSPPDTRDQFPVSLFRTSNLPDALETNPYQLKTDEDLTRLFSMSGAMPNASQINASYLTTDEYLKYYFSIAGNLPSTLQTDPSQKTIHSSRAKT